MYYSRLIYLYSISHQRLIDFLKSDKCDILIHDYTWRLKTRSNRGSNCFMKLKIFQSFKTEWKAWSVKFVMKVRSLAKYLDWYLGGSEGEAIQQERNRAGHWRCGEDLWLTNLPHQTDRQQETKHLHLRLLLWLHWSNLWQLRQPRNGFWGHRNDHSGECF